MRYLQLYKVFIVSCGLLASTLSSAQLTVTPNQTAAVLAAKLGGPGIVISAPVLTCPTLANGIFVSNSTPLTVDSGIILTSGRAANTAGAESFLASTNNGAAGDASLNTLAMSTTRDACILEFDFVPNGDTIKFNYQFGSEEYTNSTCGPYNDAFAFFISGPGISGLQNMALVPGTTIPVTVNSINSGVPGSNGNIVNCTNMGPGAPFTAYYVDNTGGTQLTYRGFTKKLTAIHDVIPCSSYHLKIAIADASNNLYDSGVFIEAGSLRTNSFSFNRADSIGLTINGTSNTIVRGCAPANVAILGTHIATSPQTVHFSYGGTAIRGTDFTAPDSATILTGTDSVLISVAALNTTSGPKTIQLFLSSPFSCGFVDSISINIMDTPSATIISADTSICRGKSFQVRASGTPGLSYGWSPALGLSSPFVMQPVASPSVTTTYSVTATLPPAAGCPSIVDDITVTVTSIAVGIVSPDTSVCPGSSVNILVSGDPTYTYTWSPAAGLSNAAIKEPTATPAGTTTYILTAVSSGGCIANDSITINVAPANVTILTPDTLICAGHSVLLRVSGDPLLTYTWSPASSLDNPTAAQPLATPGATTTYHFTATLPGTVCSASGDITIRVTSVTASAGSDMTVCLRYPIQLSALPDLTGYTYLWNGPDGYTSTEREPEIANAQMTHDGLYTVRVTDNINGCFSDAATHVTVIEHATLTNVTPDQTIAYGSTVQLNASSALYYTWTPADGTINNPNINNPVVAPLASTTYVVYGRDVNGCLDSATVRVDVTTDTLFIPSGFTPNGDGLNDLFRVGNIGYNKLVEMSIFNRWGTTIYHVTDGSNKGWDGTYNGMPQDLGVYHYLIIVSQPDGKLRSYKGDITLIR